MKSSLSYKIVLPLVLGIIASLAIMVYAELGYRRLEVANERMAAALEMQVSLHEVLALVVTAETAQRGYMLTNNSEYLQPYVEALPKIDAPLSHLRELLRTNGTKEQRESVARFNNLIGKKLAEMEAVIVLYQMEGMDAAQRLINTGIGKRTMEGIRVEVDAMSTTHRQQLDDATRRWSADIAFGRLGMEMITAFTVALLLIVWLLARRDAQKSEERRLSVLQEKQRLESIVNERTAELSELSNHLQAVREDEKAKLSRNIHDELGGILVSAKMDVAWVESRLKGRDPESAVKLVRALQVLDDGVEIKRRIIEELRPTLLDNLGLSAALDWQVREICKRADLKCEVSTPADDSAIDPQIAIALYRILQEALTNVTKYARAKLVNVDLGVSDGTVTLIIEDDGIGITDGAQNNRLSHGIVGMRQRVKALSGEFSIGRRPEGGTIIEINVPLGKQDHTEPTTAPALA